MFLESWLVYLARIRPLNYRSSVLLQMTITCLKAKPTLITEYYRTSSDPPVDLLTALLETYTSVLGREWFSI